MTNRRHLVFLLPLAAALIVCGLSVTASFFPAHADGKKKLTLRQWKKKMNGWAREVGQKCVYCHVKDGEEFDYKADHPKKTIAHYCEEEFVEKLFTAKNKPVSCATCHNKKTKFLPREKDGE